MRILIVFGTRPEAIKMAPLVNILKKENLFNVKVCVTAQHRDMLDQVLKMFKIKPDYDLNLMKSNQSINQVSSKILKKVDEVLEDFNPELVLVHGDTSTSLYTTLASYNRRIKVGHIEAGLRTNDLDFPWPEESNRQIVGKLASLHFAPTTRSRKNLIDEGQPKKNIFVTGNTVIDSLIQVINIIEGDNKLQKELKKRFAFLDNRKKLILVTGHRRENFGSGLESICEALKELALKEDIEIIYAVHLNPNIKKPVNRILRNVNNVHLVDPLDYIPFVYLMKRSYLILTDSGGIQEEAPSIGKPVLVMRDKTERPEALKAGTVKLVGSNKDKIVTEVDKLLNNEKEYNKISFLQNPYGDGNASEKIKEILLKYRLKN